ncbi:hypothetical protein OS493_035563, partial [Desmophyllum pertusum]
LLEAYHAYVGIYRLRGPRCKDTSSSAESAWALKTTHHGSLAEARPDCQQRCDTTSLCKAFRLYSFVGTVFCTLFERVSDYSCPPDSTDWNCFIADGSRG